MVVEKAFDERDVVTKIEYPESARPGEIVTIYWSLRPKARDYLRRYDVRFYIYQYRDGRRNDPTARRRGRIHEGYQWVKKDKSLNKNSKLFYEDSAILVDPFEEKFSFVMPEINKNLEINMDLEDSDLYYKGEGVSANYRIPRNSYEFRNGGYILADIKLNTNYLPNIDGADINLGEKINSFDINYTVTDRDNDVCKVNIFLDTEKVESDKEIILGKAYSYSLSKKFATLSLGNHTVKIVATDSKNESSTRIYTFTKVNEPPVISGEDKDLGDKNTAFTEKFSVSDSNNDSLKVYMTLDGEQLNYLSNVSGEQSYTVDFEKLKSLELGQHKIIIKADDGKGGISYRTHTFNRVKVSPIISVDSKPTEYQEISSAFDFKFRVSDPENRKLRYRVNVNGNKSNFIDYKNLTLGNLITVKFNDEFIKKLAYKAHYFVIDVAEQDKDEILVSQRFNFTRIANGIDVEFKINEFTTKPKKILAVAHGDFADDSTITIKACNNYLDSSPTWEDITSLSKMSKAHTFTNATKTNAKWAIGIKIVVTPGKSKQKSILKGIKGGYE